MPRARQADVEQTCLLRMLLGAPGLLGVLPFRFRHVDLPVQAALVVVAAVRDAGPARRRFRPADAGERQEHQRVFQALALVQGDDLHPARVGFQPKQLGLVVRVGVGDARAQPLDQAVQAQGFGLRLLQRLCQLQVVADPAFAIGEP